MGDASLGFRGAATAGVIVAAGAGGRFGAATPKQFLELSGRPLVWWAASVLARHPAIRRLVLVLPEGRGVPWSGWPPVSRVVAGGSTRAESVAAGLEVVEEEFVLVHDGVRPWVPQEVVDEVLRATWAFGAAAPVRPVVDALKRVGSEGWIEGEVAREGLHGAQTPQGARTAWLRAALETSRRASTDPPDEAAALRQAGYAVRAVPGSPGNLKVTESGDLEMAARWLAGPELRVGCGFDVHRFDPVRPLVLGGVRLADSGGLAGHSDADVAIHAVLDAILGAAGLGDLGEHFPPDEARWAGVASTELARDVRARIGQLGLEIVHVDLTLVGERPRIARWRKPMQEAIAAALDLEAQRVNVKATSPEGLGALGRAEGLACHAVALLRRVAVP